MTSCPPDELLAAAVSGEAPALDDHVATCLRCMRELELHRALIARARGVAVPALSKPRRMALVAETLARADAEQHRGTRITLAAALATAAGVAIVIAVSPLHERLPIATAPVTLAPLPVRVDPPVPQPPPPARVDVPVQTPAPRPAALASSDGVLERTRLRGRDTIHLHDGTLVVDARDRTPVSVVAGDVAVAIADSRVKLVAVGDVVISVHVVIGAADLTRGDMHDKLAVGATWTPAVAPATSLALFRAGWKALRDEHFADALAAFDLARDPVVAEDAAYWAAVAASRAGRDHEARTRFEAFLQAFPDSTRADAARAALAAIDP
jgi:hypothetical protein